jgi:hypothetical protein
VIIVCVREDDPLDISGMPAEVGQGSHEFWWGTFEAAIDERHGAVGFQ